MVKRILLALGGTPFSHVAVRRGVELAQAHGSQLVAVTILDTDFWQASTSSWMSAAEAARLAEARSWIGAKKRVERVVAEFMQACADADVPCEVKRPDHEPFELLSSESRYCDLVLFGLRGLFDYHLVPDAEKTIARLIRGGVRPMLAVASEYRPVRRVLIAYSGSMESATTMRRFVQMRLWPSAVLKIVCFEHDVTDAGRLLAGAAEYCQAHGFVTTTEAVDGSARGSLLPYAQNGDMDLIVAGDSFRHVVLQDLLGDTMSHLVRHADRPLFLSH